MTQGCVYLRLQRSSQLSQQCRDNPFSGPQARKLKIQINAVLHQTYDQQSNKKKITLPYSCFSKSQSFHLNSEGNQTTELLEPFPACVRQKRVPSRTARRATTQTHNNINTSG